MRLSSYSKYAVAAVIALVGCRVTDLVRSPPGSIAFSAQPSDAESSKPIAPPVEVTVYNSAGAPDSAVPRMITIQLAANPGDATLSGQTEVETVAGVARFANLRIDEPGQGYALRAVVREGGAAASDSFDVVRPPAAQLI